MGGARDSAAVPNATGASKPLQEPPSRYRSIPTVTGASQKIRGASSPNPNVFEEPNRYSIIPTVTAEEKFVVKAFHNWVCKEGLLGSQLPLTGEGYEGRGL